MKCYTAKKPRQFLALVFLVLLFLLLLGSPQECLSMEYRSGGGAQGAVTNITVMGTVFCDACSSSSFSNHSYFLPGVKVRIDCMIKVNSKSKEEITVVAEKTTDRYGIYELYIPAVNGFACNAGRDATESFCKAALLNNPSALCNIPAVANAAAHVSLDSQDSGACLYNLNALYYRPSKKDADQCGMNASSPTSTLNVSLFFCPPWPFPPIPFCTPRPWFTFPPIPFFTPPPPSFPFPLPPLPPIPFFTPSPPPPSFPFPFLGGIFLFFRLLLGVVAVQLMVAVLVNARLFIGLNKCKITTTDEWQFSRCLV